MISKCGYSAHIISKAFNGAALQGPAPHTDRKNTLPFITKYHSNVDNKSLVTNIRKTLNNSNSAYLKEIFKNSNIILPILITLIKGNPNNY